MPPFELFRSMWQQASQSGTRTTVLQPLIVLITILVPALVFGAFYNAPTWALELIAGCLILAVFIFLFFYVYFAFRDPELLRTERFTQWKMALEKNVFGDTTAGFHEVEERTIEIQAIPAPAAERSLEEGRSDD